MSKKILVTGGSGLVGYSLKWGYVHGNSIPNATFLSSSDCDLRDPYQTDRIFSEIKPDAVIHLAAKVGGVKANIQNAADFYYDNIMINTNVLHSCFKNNVSKVISLMSTCVYPDETSYPLKEKNVHNSPPHDSNFSYAYAKRMIDIQSRSYRQQYGCNFITLIPNNLYGENDNFKTGDSHVIPSIIRKIYEAKVHKKEVTLWGDGSPLREFTYSGDMGEIVLFALENYDEAPPLNVGNSKEYSIKEVASLICEYLEFDGAVSWDISQPSGQFKKPSDNSRFLELGWNRDSYTSLKEGLRKTCDWFVKNYPRVRL